MVEKSSPSGLTPCTPRRVLIVDDEKGIRDVFLAVVSYGLPDCRVDLAVNGAEAVENFRTAHQDVLVMDLNMPVMNGLDAFAEIRKICDEEKWAMPAVVFCTGFDPPNALNAILQSDGRHRLLRKPVTNELLIQTIGERLTP